MSDEVLPEQPPLTGSSALLRAPSLRRRLAAMLYESFLLFGVLMLAGFLFAGLTQQRHALWFRWELQLYLFAVLGAYFLFFWTRSGQTLPMQTWRLRVADRRGAKLSARRALVRYVLAWLWVLPGLLLVWWLGLQRWQALSMVTAWVIFWALASWLRPDRQFWHDVLAGTRLLDVRQPA